jgi:hypothetical protein
MCSTPLVDEYHEFNGQPVCASCREGQEKARADDLRWSRFPKAVIFGLGAAIAGAILYWAFVRITKIELGIMAIAIGWMVGKAVMKGSRYRGGRRFQVLALLLTYFSITLSYGALIVEEIFKRQEAPAKTADAKAGKAEPRNDGGLTPAPGAAPADSPSAAPADTNEGPPTPAQAAVALGVLWLLALASPFLSGFSNFMGWVIIAIGLWEAWRHTRGQPFVTGGPYRFGEEAPVTPDGPEA